MDDAPPERLDLGDGHELTRCRLAHAIATSVAVTQSLDHLRPWMPWATAAGATIAAQKQRLVQVERDWDERRDFSYVVQAADDDNVLGGASLMTRMGPGILEIGYWLHVDACGRGLATRAAAAMTSAALDVTGIDMVVIRCDEANHRSARIPDRLGYQLDRIDPYAPEAPAQTGWMMVWEQARVDL